MKWIKNLENISAGKNVGECPFCCGLDTDYKATLVEHTNGYGYLDIWCNTCYNGFHVSRIKIDKGLKSDGNVPKEIKY